MQRRSSIIPELKNGLITIFLKEKQHSGSLDCHNVGECRIPRALKVRDLNVLSITQHSFNLDVLTVDSEFLDQQANDFPAFLE